MGKTCTQCSSEFVVTEKDIDLLERISPVYEGKKVLIPWPLMCPLCRSIRRMQFRNESTLHHRTSSLSGKKMLSIYDDSVKFPVYSYEEWVSDEWDSADMGMDFDFSRPFFEQFIELRDRVPHPGLIFSNNQNCDYCNIVGNSKDCYLCFGSINCEGCLYGNPFFCIKCVDSLLLRNSELCLECSDSDKLYECFWCQNCSNSRNLMFCDSVHNSSDCFACVNLNHKKYCILNKQYTKEEYERIVKSMDLSTDEGFDLVLKKFNDLKGSLPHRAYIGVNNEDVSGNYIFNSKDCHDCYGIADCQDVNYSYQMVDIKDGMDLTNGEIGELLYNISALFDNVSKTALSYFLWGNIEGLYYSAFCNMNVRDCFGCVGLKHKQYCILNKQYTKEEYEEKVNKIIEHMKSTGEWGKFFPVEVSPFGYNETIAGDFYPLTKDEVLAKGWKWNDAVGAEREGGDALRCEVMNRPFRIIPQEKAMYERFGVRLPTRCWKQRHLDRVALRNPMELFDRSCDKCGEGMKTTYSPDRPEKVYCEKCYLKEVY